MTRHIIVGLLASALVLTSPGCAKEPPGSPPRFTPAAANVIDGDFATACTDLFAYVSEKVPIDLKGLVCPGAEKDFDAEVAKLTAVSDAGIKPTIADAGAPARRLVRRTTGPLTGTVCGSIAR